MYLWHVHMFVYMCLCIHIMCIVSMYARMCVFIACVHVCYMHICVSVHGYGCWCVCMHVCGVLGICDVWA